MAVKDNPQREMFRERMIEDLEFEDALREMFQHKAAKKAYDKARRVVADKAEAYELQPDEVLRVGVFTIEAKERAGGGFEVPAWGPKVTVGRIDDGS